MIKLQTNNDEAEKHYQVVKPVVQEWIGKVKRRGYVRYNQQRHNLSPTLRTYLTSMEKGDDGLRPLVCAHPSNFEGIIDYMRHYHAGSMQLGTLITSS
jgi:hypothetical protein